MAKEKAPEVKVEVSVEVTAKAKKPKKWKNNKKPKDIEADIK